MSRGVAQRPPRGASGFTRWWLALLVLAVHLLAVDRLVQDRLGAGAGEASPRPMEVAFVRDLDQQAPALAAPAPLAAPPAEARLPAVVAAADAKPVAKPPRPAASAAVSERAGPAEPAEPVPAPERASLDAPARVAPEIAAAASAALPPPPPPPPAGSAVDTASVAAVPTAAGAPASNTAAPAAATGFAWPPSTRLSFKLQGHYHGPVEGGARVEWVRQGSRYQVRLDSHAGPLFSRKVLSEGELTERGLVPQRFSGEQKVLFASPRRWSLAFSPEQATLSDGRTVPSQPGQQDEASQFVQITWLFSTRPELLQVGRSVEFPLAISRRLERWTFDVVAQETLQLPMGEVAAFHIKPRREAAPGDMSAEMWIAPSLQYLPVRILIRQRNEHWVDLTLARAPQQATE